MHRSEEQPAGKAGAIDRQELEKAKKRFKCWKCGACCMLLPTDELPEAGELDDGTGKCVHFDAGTRRCSIFAERPLFCDVWGAYETVYFQFMSPMDYALASERACHELREQLGMPQPEDLIARKKSKAGKKPGAGR